MKSFRSWLTKHMKPGLVVLVCLGLIVAVFASTNTKTLQTWIGGTTYESASSDENMADFAALLDSIDVETPSSADTTSSYVACLHSKHVVLYAGDSCGFSCADVKKYGKHMKEFRCVDCDADPTVCTDLGITDLPVRVAGAKKVYNVKSLQQLAEEFTCE